jgi:hypothetical protein
VKTTNLTLFATIFALVAYAQLAAAVEPATKNGGDTREIKFVLPFDKALDTAKKEQRLIFLKPIYGGVDQLGAQEYRCGNW